MKCTLFVFRFTCIYSYYHYRIFAVFRTRAPPAVGGVGNDGLLCGRWRHFHARVPTCGIGTVEAGRSRDLD